jgi:hypothetical protein
MRYYHLVIALAIFSVLTVYTVQRLDAMMQRLRPDLTLPAPQYILAKWHHKGP